MKMTQQQPGQPVMTDQDEKKAWWKIALHLDEAHATATNVMALNVEDPTMIHALHDRITEARAILFDIFVSKKLLPPVPAKMPAVPMVPPIPPIPPVVVTSVPTAPPAAAQNGATPPEHAPSNGQAEAPPTE